MLFFYTGSKMPFFSFCGSHYLIDTNALFSPYKERFVISPENLGFLDRDRRDFPDFGMRVDCLFTYFFSYEIFWWGPATGRGLVPSGSGTFITPNVVLGDTLKQRRSFLLQFGQRRVCTRALAWFVTDFWAVWAFDGVRSNIGGVVSSRYTYKHLAESDCYKAGVLLGQPNLYLFVYILSNPYFWSLLQQTLSSQYRYK